MSSADRNRETGRVTERHRSGGSHAPVINVDFHLLERDHYNCAKTTSSFHSWTCIEKSRERSNEGIF